jgi:hypothetical protein
MGMDVIGRQPKNKRGEYFRRNVWGWRPLADYVLRVAPDTASACRGWHFNDGDGLNQRQSLELAEVLRNEIASGRAAKYVHRRNSILAAMPDEECPICKGTDKQPPKADGEYIVARELAKTSPCDHCKSTRRARPWATLYHLDVCDIEEFASFLEDCGGFCIY